MNEILNVYIIKILFLIWSKKKILFLTLVHRVMQTPIILCANFARVDRFIIHSTNKQIFNYFPDKRFLIFEEKSKGWWYYYEWNPDLMLLCRFLSKKRVAFLNAYTTRNDNRFIIISLIFKQLNGLFVYQIKVIFKCLS